MPKKFKDAKTSADDGKKWEDDLPFEMKDIREVAKGEYKQIRLVGFIEPFMRFWVPTEASKAYDPYKLKSKMYPSICVDFDPAEEVFSGNECLYRKAHFEYVDSETGESKWGKLRPTKNYLIFFIDREMQEERAGIPLKKKCLQAKKFSDVKCATVPTAFAREVQNAIEMFTKKTKKEVDPTDPDEGFDIFFKFDPAASAEAKYNIMLGDASVLTKEENKQLTYLPDVVNIYPKDSPAKIRESLQRHGYIVVETGQTPEEAVAAASVKKAKKSVMKAGAEMLDDDEDTPEKAPKEEEFEDEKGDLGLDEDDDDENTNTAQDEDSDEAPAEKEEPESKSESKPKPKADAEVDSEDEEEFTDEEFSFGDDDEF